MELHEIEKLNAQFANSTPEEVIGYFINLYGNKIALSSSLGAEDQVLTHMAWTINPQTTVFTLDTGRLFSETYDLIDRTSKKYKNQIKVYFPDSEKIQAMVNEKGINLFYDSVENRKLCCHLRKIEPLQRAFASLDAWICGLRSQQSVTRSNIHVVEWDTANRILKINPLANWTEEQVWDYIKLNKIPYNPLHDKNYPSIGCQPCTQPVQPGQDIRAGRWWWENPETKECGLHKR